MSSCLYRTSLTSPDLLAALRRMLSNAVVSRHTQRAYLAPSMICSSWRLAGLFRV